MDKSGDKHPASGPRGLLVGAAVAAAILALPLDPAAAGDAEEIAALKKENAELREMVKSLAQDVKALKETVDKTAEAVAAPKAPAKMVSSGKENVALTVSGQVSRILLYADDGNESTIFNADNDYASTRINVTGAAKVTDDLTASAVIEADIESNSTDRIQIQQDRADDTNAFWRERRMELIADSKTFGKLSAGQGSTASDGTAETILSNATVIAGSDIDNLGTRLLFLREDTKASSGRTVGNLFFNSDGFGRDDRIRYDSPSFMGLTASTSYSDGDRWDAALRYKKKYEFGTLEAATSYFDARTTGTPGSVAGFSGMAASAAYKAPFGTSIQGTYSEMDFEQNGRDTANFWYAALGHDAKFTEIGETSLIVAYAHTQDQAVNGSSGDFWALAAVQMIDKASTELYFTVGQFMAELPGNPSVDLEDITVAGVGARVKF